VLIVGGGYVGLPLAVQCAKNDYHTTVFDVDERKVNSILDGISYIGDVPTEELAPLVEKGRLGAAANPYSDSVLYEADIVIICVPTPLNKTKDPDVSMVMDAARHLVGDIAPEWRGPKLVILESTVYPGFTREMLGRELQKGLVLDKDFFLAFSPERVDPGNSQYNIENTPKLVGGATVQSGVLAHRFYESIIREVHHVSSCEVAEMAKILENTFRMVNIALANEAALICRALDLDVWEVIDSAATKPFGFTPFRPGPGTGGHCIPVDPHYLSWKLKTLNHHSRLIEVASRVNAGMPAHVAILVTEALNRRMRSMREARILVLGVAYKPGVSDLRESPALDVMMLLWCQGAKVRYYDPYVPRLKLSDRSHHGHFESLPEEALLDEAEKADCVVIITDHADVPYREVCARAPVVVDARNATKRFREVFSHKIIVL
jgi:UDP-N-acetyl-D-glucosamine dehydrogenase